MRTGLAFFYTSLNRNSVNALAGALENHPVATKAHVCFFYYDHALLPETGRILETHDKALLCFSFCTPQKWETQELVAQLRMAYGNRITLIAGGPHATGDPKGTLAMGFDYAVLGEAEETFPALAEQLLEDGDVTAIKGIAFYQPGAGYMHTGPAGLVDLDAFPPFSLRYDKLGSIEITRGCPFSCHFCQATQLTRGTVRHRKSEAIVAAVAEMRKRDMYNIRFVSADAFAYGSPDGLGINLHAMEELLTGVNQAIGKKGRVFFGNFPAEVRPEHVTTDTVALVLKYACNKNIVVGAQTGSQRLLDLCNRGHTVNDVYQAIDIACSASLKPFVDFIFGLPGETEDDALHTVRMMQALVKMGATIHAHTFMPLPGTGFEHEPCGAINPAIRKIVERELLPKGALFGQWEKQEKVTAKLLKNNGC